ncbi:ABC transporter substrate-binding protein [Actinoplanes solisilvae]|uniref:ABC transporter substrate-binding protein n=1 Tax=Actinoplanes solisilvae TaxID=2486853 RepID=UPI000FDC6E91|nr:ABC transporter substrate-binding protein [Actinoplanes solisilvae]
MTQSRRTVLKGAAALGAIPILAACTGGDPASSSDGKATSLGSGLADAVPKSGIQAMVDGFQTSSGDTVRLNVMPRDQLVNNISTYLQANPEDVITWFAGYRMRFYADKGLLAPIDDVWEKIGANFGTGLAAASSHEGKKYLVPNYNYPWVVFYRKSVFQQHGYQVPKTFDALVALCAQMKKDGLSPIAFGGKDGWPAMGTFDYLNMRTNGYQFHVDLCAHKESWDSPKVKAVFDNWKALLPYQDTAALGQSWQQAAKNLANKKSGLYVIGTFLLQEITDKSVVDDLDFFPFPEIAVEGTEAVEAPIDGFVMSKRAEKNKAAKDFLAYLGTPAAQDAYAAKDPSNLQTAAGANTSSFSPIQKKAAELIAASKNVSQFFDRDALPAMASNVMIPALQGFVKDGTIDTRGLEAQAKTLYASA